MYFPNCVRQQYATTCLICRKTTRRRRKQQTFLNHLEYILNSSSAPRMVNNYKRTSSPRSPTNSGELFTPAHEENVRFIHDTWQCVLRDIRSPQSSERKDRGPQEYVEKNPNPNLNSFTPVDLSDLKKRNTQDSKKS
uniref:Mapk-regulated corepressor-interacting protein 1 n=1 Tax=Oncorhynchus tshawytscha TaxID=74940 RepID=A0AAZ3RYX2_ONCTS